MYNTEAGMKLELKKIGNSTGLILPKELLAELDFKQGDWVTLTATAEGALQLRRSDPVFDKGMEIAERAMDTYRNALEELAK
jgi:putative addiction module antidote